VGEGSDSASVQEAGLAKTAAVGFEASAAKEEGAQMADDELRGNSEVLKQVVEASWSSWRMEKGQRDEEGACGMEQWGAEGLG